MLFPLGVSRPADALAVEVANCSMAMQCAASGPDTTGILLAKTEGVLLEDQRPQITYSAWYFLERGGSMTRSLSRWVEFSLAMKAMSQRKQRLTY